MKCKGGKSWTKRVVVSESTDRQFAWSSICSDSSGQYLGVTGLFDNNGPGCSIYISSSGGTSWTLSTAPRKYWDQLVSDSTGTHLAVLYYMEFNGQQGGYIYISSNGNHHIIFISDYH